MSTGASSFSSTTKRNEKYQSNPLKYQSTVDITQLNSSHVQIINKVAPDSRVLDVGCACGDIGAYLAHHLGCKVWGMEYCVESIDVACATNAYEAIMQVDLNTFDGYAAYENRNFDYILFGDVLEHLMNPVQVLDNFIALLAPAGKVIISLPNIAHGSILSQLFANKFEYMEYGILDKTHLRFFTHETIARDLSELGLSITKATRTIWDLSGMHPHRPFQMLPSGVVHAIAANPHAYVLQYVVEAAVSKASPLSVQKNNEALLTTFTGMEMQLIEHFRSRLPQIDTSLATPVETKRPVDYIRKFRLHASISEIKLLLKKMLPKAVVDNLREARTNWRYKKLKKTVHAQMHARAAGEHRPAALEPCFRYIQQILQLPGKKTEDFVAITEKPFIPEEKTPKLIAFYLPQFHPFEQNDAWWGRGFTEWTNVTKAVPQFVGHYQPHLPIDLGFYDLRIPDVMDRQIELAKLYGIHGFCFHYYWFSGTRLMEKPIFNYLNNKNFDLPFCLCWANESWSRRWDGSEHDILITQTFTENDDELFMQDLLPFLQDSRYIRIKGKPVLVIYKPTLWEKARVRALCANFRRFAKKNGFSGLYLVTALSHGFTDEPRDWGFDAGVEFPPHMCGCSPQIPDFDFINSDFCGTFQDMDFIAKRQRSKRPSEYTTFQTVCPSWDNTARRPNNPFIFYNATPKTYKTWLTSSLEYTRRYNSVDEQFVFVNAWNEWAEGAHLEPDRKYGYAFLRATGEALEGFQVRSDKS